MVDQLKEGLIRLEDGIFASKDRLGWSIKYPVKDPLTRKLIKRNLFGGSWWRIISIIFVVAIILFGAWSYQHDTKICRDIAANPCDYCSKYGLVPGITGDFNISNFNISNENEKQNN